MAERWHPENRSGPAAGERTGRILLMREASCYTFYGILCREASAYGAGHRAIFESYYRQYYRQIVIHAYRFLQNWPMANEAAQETFLVAWRRFEVFRSSENQVGWLKVTAKNVALNMMARAHREQKLFISMCEVPESAVAGTGELPVSAELLFQNMMTEDEIHLLKRIVLEKATYLELAKELNISVWACQKRMQRLLKKLKHSLDDG